MVERVVRTLKFSGVVSLGLLTGFSYSITTLMLPTLLSICTSSGLPEKLKTVSNTSLKRLRILASLSSSSFFLAYLLSPFTQKHPYLLWTTLLVGSSFLVDFIPTSLAGLSDSTASQESVKNVKPLTKSNNQLDSSYEVLNKMNHSDDDENEGSESNETEFGVQLKSCVMTEQIRTTLTGVGFAMSIVGIWGERFSGVING